MGLTNQEIEELDAFLLSDDDRENAMDVSGVDGFLCAVLSGPNVIMPSEWMRWVWDSAEGKQSPEFTSEKQAQRILDLLMRHANDIAVTLTEVPQYYEPLFLERDHKGRTVSIVDEWCCGYVKGIALDPSGWQPLVEAHPDWFEVIHLYGTESGWDRLKKLVEAHEDADARHQVLVDLIAPAARNIAQSSAFLIDALKEGMTENGLAEGRDYVLDVRWAEGDYKRFAAPMAWRK
jgi:uncharacterized protein